MLEKKAQIAQGARGTSLSRSRRIFFPLRKKNRY
jgi:hypothetical protein